VRAKPSPDQRIEAAIAEIKAAMMEKHPNWEVQVKNDMQDAQIGPNPDIGPEPLFEPYCHSVLIYSYSGRAGRERAGGFRTYLG
jgi:hypothetical protein